MNANSIESDARYSIAVFAYNEESGIERCIRSLYENSDSRLDRVVVLANGCSDRTVEISNALISEYSNLEVLEIEVPDKCNAWNTYVHETASLETPVHFFVDADVWFVGDVFKHLSKALSSSDVANAAAGFPMSGRNREAYAKLMTERYCLFGNCYALKSQFLSLIREKKFSLPIGLMWIDSAITKAVNSDLEDQRRGHNDRIVSIPGCGYAFDSLFFLNPSDIKLYLSRIARYETGKLQKHFLEQIPFDQWPESLSGINQRALKKLSEGGLSVPWYLKRGVRRRLGKVLPS